MSANNSIESSSSSPVSNDNIVSNNKLNLLAEQQQLQANEIGPRRFCDRVLFDALHFLRRREHAQVRLVCRRLQWLSDVACASYPPREVSTLEVRGVYADPFVYGVSCAKWVRRQIVANSMRVYPDSGGNAYLADFPAVEPPEDIVRLSTLVINDFIGSELLQFLRVSTRLMDNSCHIVFTDFDNFVRHHSTDFIVRFFALFPSKDAVHLDCLSSLTAPLFIDHPTMFDCNELRVRCLDTFPLDALQGWLHQPPSEKQQMERHLVVRFEDEFDVDHTVLVVGHFVQQLRQHFLYATFCCPFTVGIGLFGGEDHAPPDLDPFVEDNERTGERLELSRDHRGLYTMERGRQESARREEGDEGEAETEKGATTKTTVFIIRGVIQGDKQPDPEMEH